MSVTLYVVMVSVTATWLLVAIRIARFVSRRFPHALAVRSSVASRRRLIILVVIGVSGAAPWFWFFDPYLRHFKSPLPVCAKLLHYEKRSAGLDVSYAFVFETQDDQLLNQLIQEWKLKPSVPDDHEPMSFVALNPPAWWPSKKQLETLPVQYEWSSERKERYRSVWLDRDKRLLYAEYGQWQRASPAQ